jgi:hypothetical protein
VFAFHSFGANRSKYESVKRLATDIVRGCALNTDWADRNGHRDTRTQVKTTVQRKMFVWRLDRAILLVSNRPLYSSDTYYFCRCTVSRSRLLTPGRRGECAHYLLKTMQDACQR